MNILKLFHYFINQSQLWQMKPWRSDEMIQPAWRCQELNLSWKAFQFGCCTSPTQMFLRDIWSVIRNYDLKQYPIHVFQVQNPAAFIPNIWRRLINPLCKLGHRSAPYNASHLARTLSSQCNSVNNSKEICQTNWQGRCFNSMTRVWSN